MAASKPLTIEKADTFVWVVRWGTTPIVYKAITEITQSAPVVIKAVGHGLPDGWGAAVVSVKGMREINAKNNPPRTTDFHSVTVLDADRIEINEVNSADFAAYTSGGYLQYDTPMELSGYGAELVLMDKEGGTPFFTASTTGGQIAIDTAAKTITTTIPSADVAGFTRKTGYYELRMTSAAGVATTIVEGPITLTL